MRTLVARTFWYYRSCMRLELGAAVNWKPSKKKSVERIDGIVALDWATCASPHFVVQVFVW